MNLTPLHSRRVEAGNLSLDQIAASTQVTESAKITEVSRAFEAVLLRQILAESQRPVFQTAAAGNSTTAGIYRDMIVNQLAESISKSGSFGVGQSLARELQHQLVAPKSAPPEPHPAPQLHFTKPNHRP